MQNEEIVIVSNRLPITAVKEDGKLSFTRSSGGLATSMSSLPTKKLTWVGWPGIASDDLTKSDFKIIIKELKKYNYVPVFLTQEEIDHFYFGYSNSTLWPLFHYFPLNTEHDEDNWQSYKQINVKYAEIVSSSVKKNALIWVHDYHLLLLPQQLREALPESSIGFFLHTPFPSSELIRTLPHRAELLQGILGSDLVGFHTHDYARHFMSSVLRILGYENKHGDIITPRGTVRTDAFPIGIDYEKFAGSHLKASVKKEEAILEEAYKGQKIIVSIDRVDYSKGILERLKAYGQFLEENTDYSGKVTMVVVLVPSRMQVSTYQQLRDEIEQLISRINGNNAKIGWSPINYMYMNMEFDKLCALYNQADVALVTPLRDGMNLVAKEFIASKTKKTGALILSEMAGAAAELPEAFLVNPNHQAALARTIKAALELPATEKRRRITAMQKRVERYTISWWAEDFTTQLLAAKSEQGSKNENFIDAISAEKIQQRYTESNKRLLLLDYDGTLAPFALTPDEELSRPSKQLLGVLRKLAGDKNTRIVIVSGRPKNVLESWFREIPVSLVAEHGGWMLHDGTWVKHRHSLKSWKQPIKDILQHFSGRTPGSVVEEKDFALVWHYRNVWPSLAYARREELLYEVNQAVEDTDIGVFEGNKIIEIKPKAIDKGDIAQQFIGTEDPDFILCAGDDYTDEDMFKALPQEAFTIKVGYGQTAAHLRAENEQTILQLLKDLAANR